MPASLLQESWGQRFESLVSVKRKTVCDEQFAAEHCGNAGVWMEALIVMFNGLCMHVYSVERLYVALYLWFLLFSVCSYLILEYYKWMSNYFYFTFLNTLNCLFKIITGSEEQAS